MTILTARRQAPASLQLKTYAFFRAAWRARGRAEVDREELEFSDGPLGIRAHQREATWSSRDSGNDLVGTHQAAARTERKVPDAAGPKPTPTRTNQAQALPEAEKARALGTRGRVSTRDQ